MTSTEPRGTGPMDRPPRLTYQARALQELLRARIGPAIQRHGLTPGQFTALAHLAQEDGISASELGRILFVSPQAAHETVRALERKGLLARSTDPVDRRSVTRTPTAAGVEVLASCEEAVQAIEAEAFYDFRPSEVKVFRALLARCIDTLSTPD